MSFLANYRAEILPLVVKNGKSCCKRKKSLCQKCVVRKKKQDDIRMKEKKVLQEKEKLTSEIVLIGLWQTKGDVEQLLRQKSETRKRRQ